jgi:hypothetical protein
MTALNAAILFNNSTGSDTQSSGSSAGANVFGSGASTTSGSAVVTGITTTGVQAGDLLWVQSSSGRQFSVIASVDSGTQVTCDDTFANTESSRTWAIGGKRATLGGSSQLFEFDYSNGKSITAELETDQTLTGSIASGSRGVSVVLRSDGTSNKTITFGGQYLLQGGGWTLEGLNFKTTNSVGRIGLSSTPNNVQTLSIHATDCIFGDTTNPLYKFGLLYSRNFDLVARRCVFKNFSNIVFENQNVSLDTCLISNNSSWIYSRTLSSPDASSFSNCVMHNNTEGFNYPYSVNVKFHRNVFHACGTTNPIFNVSTSASNVYRGFYDNIFSSCPNAISSGAVWFSGNNAVYNCGFSSLPSETNSITLTADPFVDAANDDFKLNADAGGGATLRANNFSLNTDTAVYPFRQYVSDAFGGGGGGAVLHPLRSN